MNRIFITFILFLLGLNTYAQAGKVISTGIVQSQLSGKEYITDKINLSHAMLTLDWMSGNAFGFGLEVHKSILTDELVYFDLKLKVGLTLNKGKRIQFPTYAGFKFYSFNDKNADQRFGTAGFAFKSAIRFYLSSKFCLDLGAQYDINTVGSINGKEFEDPEHSFSQKGLYASIGYFIPRKKK